jgi:sulfinoalanine decarboxylase/sulfinoalanine decarboxylase/aspartate 1-decarboxylase
LLKDEEQTVVADYIPSDKLFTELDLQLYNEGMEEESFLELLSTLVLKTPRTGTSGFFNQLFGGRNDKAILGELLSVMLNNSMYTYKAAGPQIGVEKVIIRKVCDLLGWSEKASGTFAPGGSMTNFMGLLMARDKKNNCLKTEPKAGKLTIYTSDCSHYSIPKNAAFSGIGRNQVRYIQTDERGCISVKELKAQIDEDIAKGYIPTMINLTAGTTVLGAFDAIQPVVDLCKDKEIWIHVDGAYCGSVLFSKKYKSLIDGLHGVDSFSFNAHKMLGTPLSCSMIFVQEKKYLYDSFSNDASYLYQTDHDEFNLGKTSLQCGRRNDALKFWTLWKSIGTDGLENMIDHQFELADYARAYVDSNPDYKRYSFDNSVAVCFNYRNIPAEVLCNTLYEKSELMVGYGQFRENVFVRLVTINGQNSKADILKFFKTLEKHVEEEQELYKQYLSIETSHF